MEQNTFKQIVQDTDRVSVVRKVKTMNTYFKTIFRAAFATLLCLGAMSASAQLKIMGIEIFVLSEDGQELISESNDKLYIDVEFSENLHDFTTNPNFINGETKTPKLEFSIGGMGAKDAEFGGLDMNIMSFVYSPQQKDFGENFTIKDVNFPSARVIIDQQEVVIENVGQTERLPTVNQYEKSVAENINADAGSQIKLNMYKIQTDTPVITTQVGATVPVTIRRPAVAAGNLTSIALVGESDDANVARIDPSATLVGGDPSTTFYITGLSVGTTVLRVYSSLHPSEEVEVTVTVQAAVLIDPLQITAIDVDAFGSGDNGELISEARDRLEINVEFSELLYDFTQELSYTNGVSPAPEFQFRIDGKPKTAQFQALSGKTMAFEYQAQPNDYGKGFTIPNSDSELRRKVINLNNVLVQSLDGKSKLITANQYTQAVAQTIEDDPDNQAVSLNMFKLQPRPETLYLDTGDFVTLNISRPLAANGNTTRIDLFGECVSNAIVTFMENDISIVEGSSYATFYVKGNAPGTSTLRFSSTRYPSEFIEIPVEVTLSEEDKSIAFDGEPSKVIEVNENASLNPTKSVTLSLGAAPTEEVTFNVVKTGINAERVICTNAVTFPAGQRFVNYEIYAPDGPSRAYLDFSDPSGTYGGGRLSVFVHNLPPIITSPSSSTTNALGAFIVFRTAIAGEPLEITASAKDPAGSYDTLTYVWKYGVGQQVLGPVFSRVFDRPGEQAVTIELTVSDGDGGEATVHIIVDVKTGILLNVQQDPSDLAGAGTGTFEFTDPSNKIWVHGIGVRFAEEYATAGVGVKALPDPGSFLFTWIAEDGIPEIARRMPGRIPNVTVTFEKALDVYHLFSREYYVGIDGFGDVDGDGLSDAWEGKWFGIGRSDDFEASATVINDGDFGAEGNSDLDRNDNPVGDFLPLAGTVAIPNILTNGLVRVYEYPITDHGGDKWNWNGYLPHTNNPFSNIIEYRGLAEDRAEDGTWIRYADEIPKQDSPTRGNCPATNPTRVDTDGDGMDDGWEYYFWTTIMYKVNPQNWRAYDPTFSYYDADDTSEAGLPLLKTEGGVSETHTLEHAYDMFAPSASATNGTVATLPVIPGTFTVTFDGGITYTADSSGSFAAEVIVFNVNSGEEETIEIAVLTVNYVTGDWMIVPPEGVAAGTDFIITYDDGLYTKQELLDRFDPALAGDPARDTDGDGLTDYEEFLLGTNPLHWDTDGDGMPDGWEVDRGLDPLNGDRVLGHADGAIGNPDGDKMASAEKGLFKHSSVYLNARESQTFWNGEKAFGFDPRIGWREGDSRQPNFTNLEEFRVAEYYIHDLGLVDEVTPDNWLQYTTDPLDNDTNQDGIPDGWALYVGLAAIVPRTITNYDRAFVLLPRQDSDDYDYDDLSVLEEFSCVEAAAFREADEQVTVDGVTAIRRAFSQQHPEWTNKLWPTDPWNADTDGDGLSDGLEYRERPESDMNADGSTLVNLNPTSVDTDRDWLPDGWEYYHGLQTTNDTYPDFFITDSETGEKIPSPRGPYGDPDGDGLSNYQEYLTGVNYGWRYDKRYSSKDESCWLPDPSEPGSEGTEFWVDPLDISFRSYDAFDFFRPYPRPKVLQSGYEMLEELEAEFGIGPLPAADPVYGYTDLEMLQRAMVVIQTPEFLDIEEEQLVAMLGFEKNIRMTQFSYGLQPLAWDSAFYAIPPEKGGMPYYFLKHQALGIYATCHPRKIDSDNDGMDDYWEIFHGLNPIYGGDRHPKAFDENLMLGIVERNLAMSYSQHPFIFGPFSRTGQEEYRQFQVFSKWRPYYIPEPAADELQPEYYNRYWNTAIPYDTVNNPAISGCPWGDIDKDGLNNREEAFNLYAAGVQHHTDPSPYWMTDISYDDSHVRRYYSSGSFQWTWWWNYAYDGAIGAAPTYFFDFEVNEGFDTDNDNISDRAELTSDNNMGITDPLDFDNPRSSKAMYFDGYAACRTRNPYLHDKWALTSYAVELWFRAEAPYGNGTQTLIERPVVVPVDSPSTPWKIRRTFRLSITGDARLKAEFDNDAGATVSAETTIENGQIAPDVWYHVAVTMDSQKNRFNLYRNGALLASVACDLKPCTGYFPGSQIVDYSPPASSDVGIRFGDNFMFSPAPIVVGASDGRPQGIVDGKNDPVFTRFFKGWVDEVRVWDRVRKQEEIQRDLYTRYAKEDVARVNDARFAWDQRNALKATALTEFPQKLLYHYTFDSLPDVIPGPTRDPDAMIPGHYTDPVPFGYDNPWVRQARPPVSDYPGVPWWYDSGVRSTVYSTDYTYVPFIENTAAHLRQYPPFDMGGIRPVFDENYNLLGYRWRKSEDWLSEIGGEITEWNPVDPDASFDIDPGLIPNTANPYGFRYLTGLTAITEVNPMVFDGLVGLLSQYEELPIHTDMLPLLNAVADIDVEMWDGHGAGFEYATLDSDGDGLPDWWEIANGLDPYDDTGINGAYGDPDGDGLDNWGEYMAGTDPWRADTNGDGYSDYDSRDTYDSPTYGELYDDGDGIPNAWEISHGLNPNRYDAHEDPDGDGWTNFEEYMAGTDPNDKVYRPDPVWKINFLYDGQKVDSYQSKSLVAFSYSEKVSGRAMGGRYDGLWMKPEIQRITQDVVFGANGVAVLPIKSAVAANINQLLSETPSGPPPSATVVPGSVYIGGHDHEGACDEPSGNGKGRFACRPGLGIDYGSGRLSGAEPGATIRFSYDWALTTEDHLRSGWNRFFGFIDLNANFQYDSDEPAGLAVNMPSLVSWDAVDVTIPLTDKLFGYPRFSWEPLETDEPYYRSEFYDVMIAAGAQVVANLKIQKPRTFIHEGDLVNAGIDGLNFYDTTGLVYEYVVSDGDEIVDEGLFNYDLLSGGPRRQMKPIQPVGCEKVPGSSVAFRWEMDYRNQGVKMVIKNAAGKTFFNDLIHFPVRHGRITDTSYYYSATPQHINGKAYFTLPPGTYTYTITEHFRSTSSQLSRQQVAGEFRVKDGLREMYSISGKLSYFGRAEIEEDTVTLPPFSGTTNIFTATVPGAWNLIPGTVNLRLVDPNGWVYLSLHDAHSDGELVSESTYGLANEDGVVTNEYTSLSARIYYDEADENTEENRQCTIVFSDTIPAGYHLELVYKHFQKPIIVTAYRLADDAESCFSFCGVPAGRIIKNTMGFYKIDGLPSGKYAVRAFLDSNENGVLDDWESSGVAVTGSTQGPVVYTDYAPIVLPPSQVQKDIVIRDCDTDNDGLPDAWEYWRFGSLTAMGACDQIQPDLYLWQEYAAGLSFSSDPDFVDTDGDGLSDGVELRLTGTDWNHPDTDRDGVSDLEEFLSGSDPNDPDDTKAYQTLGVEFDAEGNPFVRCPYPDLVRGVVVTYTLKYKANLTDATWTEISRKRVQAPDEPNGRLDAGVLIMKPEADQVDWRNAFFKIDVKVNHGEWTIH